MLQRFFAEGPHGCRGQSTVEFAVVMAAGLGMVIAIGLLSGSLHDGMFVQHAVAAASHNVQSTVGGAIDVFAF